MKTKTILLSLTAALGVSLAPLQAAYAAPTKGQLDQLMANPNLVAVTLNGADGPQAAELLNRVVERLMAANLNESQRAYLIAYYTARFTFLLRPSHLNAFATDVIARTPPGVMTAVLSGFSLGGRGSGSFLAHVRGLVEHNEGYLQALLTPRASMSNPVYDQLVISLSASQSLPPHVIDSLPPPIPVGVRDAGSQGVGVVLQAAPPVPEPYDGQR